MLPIIMLGPDPGWKTDFEEMDAQLAELSALGLDFTLQPWTQPVEAQSGQPVLALMAWGYHQMLPQWLAALEQWKGLNLANPLEVLRWNWDKAYLMELQAKGVAVVPTRMSEALNASNLADARAFFGSSDLVIKPPVSAGADGTFLLRNGAAAPAEAMGQRTMIQPMMHSVASEGEYSLFHFGGRFSHAILKTPANGDFRVQPQFGSSVRPIDPPQAARALAEAALAAAPGPTIYARVDMVRDGDGFALMELELIEPWLALEHAADRGAMFAEVIKAL